MPLVRAHVRGIDRQDPVTSRPAQSTKPVLGQLRIHSKNLYQEEQEEEEKEEEEEEEEKEEEEEEVELFFLPTSSFESLSKSEGSNYLPLGLPIVFREKN